jgi:hypothetical protein
MDLLTELSDAVRELVVCAVREPRGEDETAAALVALACERLPYDAASIVLHERDGRPRTLARTVPDLDRVESAKELGLHGVVTFRLVEHLSPGGVLNLYTTSSAPTTTEGLATVRHFAHEVSVALHVTSEVWHLHQALTHRAVVGQATGFLMGRYDLDADQALAELTRVSSHTDCELHTVASDVLATRQLAGVVVSPRTTVVRPRRT